MKTDETCEALLRRWENLPTSAEAGGLILRRGSLKDYACLSEHHYKAARPATATRVLVLQSREPSVADRFLQGGRSGDVQAMDRRQQEPAAGLERAIEGERAPPVAVLVESLASLNCRMRDYALGNRYGVWKDAHARAALLNREVRCISRVVVHPQWRGMGLAVRLVKAALAEPTTIFTEALAAMGKINPFFQRAGMRAYPRPTHEFDARLVAALRQAGFEPVDLAMPTELWRRIESLPAAARLWLLGELQRWHRRKFLWCSASRAKRSDPRELLECARSRLLCEPVYYLRDNRASPALAAGSFPSTSLPASGETSPATSPASNAASPAFAPATIASPAASRAARQL